MIAALVFGNSHTTSWTNLDAVIFSEFVKSSLASVGVESGMDVSVAGFVDRQQI